MTTPKADDHFETGLKALLEYITEVLPSPHTWQVIEGHLRAVHADQPHLDLHDAYHLVLMWLFDGKAGTDCHELCPALRRAAPA